MKAKIRKGKDLLFCKGYSNKWDNLTDEIIINFNSKYTYIDFKQYGNHIIINTTEGPVDIVFTTGEPLDITFESFCKDQLVLGIKKQ